MSVSSGVVEHLRAIVATGEYQSVLSEVVHDVGLSLRPEGPDTDFLYMMNAEELALTPVSTDDLREVIVDGVFRNFVIAKMRGLEGVDDQEYPSGQEPDPSEPGDSIESWVEPSFLLGHAIEYRMLTEHPTHLVAYLRAAGIIGTSTAYVRDLKNFLASAQHA